MRSCDLSRTAAILRCDNGCMAHREWKLEIVKLFSMPWWGSNKIYRTPKEITEIQLLSANSQYVLQTMMTIINNRGYSK